MSYDTQDLTGSSCELAGAATDASPAANYRAIQSVLDGGGLVTLTHPGTYRVSDSFSPAAPLVTGPGVLLLTPEGGPVTSLSGYLRPMVAGIHANTLAVVGDSFTSQWANNDGSYYYQNSDGYLTWALGLSKQRMSVVGSFARGASRVSAESTTAGSVIFSTQVDSAIASGASHLIMMGGINDCFAGLSLSSIKYEYSKCVEKAVSAGMRVWLCTQPTMNSTYSLYTTAVQGKIFAINDWIRQRVSDTWARYGVTCVDLASVAVNPTSTTGNYITNGSQDNLHPRNIAAYYMGKELARVWNDSVQEAGKLLSSAADNYTYNSSISQGQTNGLMTASAGGVATGLTLSAITGATSTNTIESRSDGFGSDQQMVQVASANGDGYRIESTTVHANGFASGDKIVAECEVTVSSITNFRGCWLQLIANASVSNRGAYDNYADGTNDAALPEGYTFTHRTPPVTLNGTPTSIRIRLDSNYSGAGGATIKFGRFSIRKVTA
jgi:hypothetical protein